jgi:hypothetical protein
MLPEGERNAARCRTAPDVEEAEVALVVVLVVVLAVLEDGAVVELLATVALDEPVTVTVLVEPDPQPAIEIAAKSAAAMTARDMRGAYPGKFQS